MRIKDLATRTAKLLTGNAYFGVDNGANEVRKIDYKELAKQIIEEYNLSTLAGSAQSVQGALNALNSNLNTNGSPTVTLPSGDAATTLNTYLSSVSNFNGRIIEIQINDGATLNGVTLQPGRKLAQLLKYGEYAVISFIGWTENAHTLFIKSNGVWRVEYPILRREYDALNNSLKGIITSFTPSSAATLTLSTNNKYGSIYVLSGNLCGVYFANTNQAGTVYVKDVKTIDGVSVSTSGNTVTISSSGMSGTVIFAPILL